MFEEDIIFTIPADDDDSELTSEDAIFFRDELCVPLAYTCFLTMIRISFKMCYLPDSNQASKEIQNLKHLDLL